MQPEPELEVQQHRVIFDEDGPLGLKLGYRDSGSHPEITELVPGGAAATRQLRVGMTLQAVNGKDCGGGSLAQGWEGGGIGM